MEPIIYATGNQTIKGEFNVSYYIVEKDKSFLDWLGKLLVEVLGIEDGQHKAKFIVTSEGYDEEEIYAKEIEKMIDLHEHYSNSGYRSKEENKSDRVDIFYGKDRVFITFRKTREGREKFAQFLKKTRDWIEVKEHDGNLPVYASRKIASKNEV